MGKSLKEKNDMLGKKFQVPVDLHYKNQKNVLLKNILPGERWRPMNSGELTAQDSTNRVDDDLGSVGV